MELEERIRIHVFWKEYAKQERAKAREERDWLIAQERGGNGIQRSYRKMMKDVMSFTERV